MKDLIKRFKVDPWNENETLIDTLKDLNMSSNDITREISIFNSKNDEYSEMFNDISTKEPCCPITVQGGGFEEDLLWKAGFNTEEYKTISYKRLTRMSDNTIKYKMVTVGQERKDSEWLRDSACSEQRKTILFNSKYIPEINDLSES